MRILLVLLSTLAFTPGLHAHFTILLSENPAGKKDEPITLVYQWGHPFEHQLFDAPAPKEFQVVGPDGTVQSLADNIEKINLSGADGKPVAGYKMRFTPAERGDYTFIVTTPPMWMEEDKEFLHDTAKVVVHVQAQKGWDADKISGFRILPLTRPYGMRAGMVFQARVLDTPEVIAAPKEKRVRPQPDLPVFIERYNAKTPKALPPDELITFATKTDPNGVLTCTLPESGWWSITAQRDAGRRRHGDKDYPVRRRVTLWVFVDESPGSR